MDLIHLNHLASWPGAGETSFQCTSIVAQLILSQNNTGYLWIFNILFLLVLSCIFKILCSHSARLAAQTLSWWLSLIKLCVGACQGCFLVCKLYFTEVIICQPILNLVKWTHKLKSLNSAQLLQSILLCGKGQPAVDQVPETQIIRLAFYELFFKRKNQQPGVLTVQYLTAAAHRIRGGHCLWFFVLRYP